MPLSTITSIHYYLYPLLPLSTITSIHYYLYPLLPLPTITSIHYYLYPLLPLPTITSTHYYLYPLLPLPTITSTHYYLYPLLPLSTITSTHYYLYPLLRKEPEYLILQTASIDCSFSSSDTVLNNLILLKQHMEVAVPGIIVIISESIIMRHDDDAMACLRVRNLINKLILGIFI